MQLPVYEWTLKENPGAVFQPGDRVAYSKRFLQATGMYTGDMPFARGKVLHTQGGIVTVDWKNPEIPRKVHQYNLVLVHPQRGIMENPLTPAEAANIEAEADVHERIGKPYYDGVAEGMRDIAQQYRENPFPPVQWTYLIDLDERGEFRAHVDNSRGRTVYSIEGFDIFEDGFMKHKHDIQGLEEYLKSLQIMPASAHLHRGNPVVPFRRKTISSTGPRIDDKLSMERLYAIALTWAHGNKRHAQALVDAFVAGSATRTAIHKGKLLPFKKNPPGRIIGMIYPRCLEIRASKQGMKHDCDEKCRAAGHKYKHPFHQKACVYALEDGSIWIR